jgi:uncharacterized protein (TIGR03435 family)
MTRALLTAVSLLVALNGALAQPTPQAFEVVSIKQSTEPEGSSNWHSSPAGSLRMHNQTLKALIRIAYKVRDAQVSGGPKWLDSDRYHIDAKASGPASDSQLMILLQSLLAERFKLALHREQKPLPGYALTVAKGGVKMQRAELGGPSRSNSNRGHMTATGLSMERFAQTLWGMTGSPVSDETHLSGVFNFTLDWTREEDRPIIPGDTPAPVAAADPSAPPNIFAALQDQLGLKLEPRKIPMEILIIDHAEKPADL